MLTQFSAEIPLDVIKTMLLDHYSVLEDPEEYCIHYEAGMIILEPKDESHSTNSKTVSDTNSVYKTSPGVL